MQLEDLKKQLDENSKKIIDNMNRVHQNSGAIEILKDFKDDNKRLYNIIIVVLVMWFITGAILVYTLNKKIVQPICFDESIEMSDIVDGE